MAGKDFALVRKLLSRGDVGQKGTDQPVAIRLKYTGVGTVTSVTVTAATNIVTVSVEAGVTTTKTYAFSTYTTLGSLVDAINADGLFQAKLLDGLRSYASASKLLNGAISSSVYNGVTVWDVKVDTSASKYLAYRITYDRGFTKPKPENHRVHLLEYVYYATLNAAGQDMVQVYECTPGGIETKKLYNVSVSATLTTVNFAGGRGRLTADEGNDLIVILKDDTLADATTNFLRVTGILE